MWTQKRETLALLRHSMQMAIQQAPLYYRYQYEHGQSKTMVSCPACGQAVRRTSAALRSHVERHTEKDLSVWFMKQAYGQE